jgi:hypothetical protein
MTAIIGPGDFNGDGTADVLARNAAGVLSIYPGDGMGGLKPGSAIGSGWNAYSLIF